MKITTQNGKEVISHGIELQGRTIQCTPKNDMRKRVECGIYDNVKRATEIFSQMTIIGWNEKNAEYIMPTK